MRNAIHPILVALLAEGVDRNDPKLHPDMEGFIVALLAEGVDRNIKLFPRDICTVVALLAEGVDRNFFTPLPEQVEVSRPPRGGRG